MPASAAIDEATPPAPSAAKSWRSGLGRGKQWLADGAAYLAIRLVVAVVQTMPLDMGNYFCAILARILTHAVPVRRNVLEQNLGLVFPAVDKTAKQQLTESMWHHLLLMVCEVAWAQRRLHRCNWSRHVTFHDNQALLRYTLSDRPAVMVTGHFGNFEIGGYLVGLMGVRSTTIARRLDNPFLDRWVQRFRSAKGQDMVDKQGCAPIIDEHLRRGGVLSLLADQHAGPKGAWVPFCGVLASCHKALALFAMTSGAPMLAVFTRRLGGRPMQFESGCLGLVDPQCDPAQYSQSVTSLTHWYNGQLEQIIDRAPEQYWWLHRRWRTPPAKIAKRLAKPAQRRRQSTCLRSDEAAQTPPVRAA